MARQAFTMSSMLVRRDFLKCLAALPVAAHSADERLPVARPITQGPKFHWFGYYDKLQFDPTGRYVLGMEVDFRAPLAAPGRRHQGRHDRSGRRRPLDELGESRAWNWQQGCMLQWLPGSKTEVIWNDRDGDHFVSHILDVHTRKKRTLPAPRLCAQPRWQVGDRPRLPPPERLAARLRLRRRAGSQRQGAGARGCRHLEDGPRDRQVQPDCPVRRGRQNSLQAARLDRRQSLVQPSALLPGRIAASASCIAGACASRMATCRSPPACSPRDRTARDLFAPRPERRHVALHLARPAITSWPGPGIPRTATSSTCTRTGRTTWRWSDRT